MAKKQKRLLTPLLTMFLFTMVLANIAGDMQGLMMPLYLTDLGATVTQVGLVFTLSSLVPVALQIFGGWLSDSIGRLRTIAIGSLGGVVGFFFIVIAPTWQWVLVGISVGFFARALVGPSFGAFIADQSTEENRGKVYGVSEMIYMIVAVVAPPIAGILADNYGFKFMLLVASILYSIAAVIRFWMANRESKTSEANPEPLTLQSLRKNLGLMFGMLVAGGLITWIFITDGIRDIAFSMSHQLFPLYLERVGYLSVTQIGWLGSIFGVAMMAITLPAGWLADKLGERVPIITGFLIDGLSMFLLTRVEGFLGFAIVWFSFGIGVGLMSPAYQSLVSKAVPEKMRGIAFGLFRTSLGLLSLPAPYIGAQLWEKYNPRLPFTITAIAVLFSAIPVFFKFKLPERETSEEADGFLSPEGAEDP